MASKQTKRKLSDPPAYRDVASPLSDKHDDVVSAAEALAQLNHLATPPPHDVSGAASTLALPMSATSLQDMDEVHPIVQSVSAVLKHPIVTNAVRYYETSKRNYATFNYAAGIVENAAMPLFNRIEVNLNSFHQARLEERARLKKKRRLEEGRPKDRNEIKKRLKFCLHILKLANDNISAKVADLQDRINSKEGDGILINQGQITPVNEDSPAKLEADDSSSSELTAVSSNVPEEAQETRVEIIATVKKIIHVISNFRPSTLSAAATAPEEAGTIADDAHLKGTIREIILNLPNQFQQSGAMGSQCVPTPDRVIVFARESLDMIRRLTSVFNEQLEKAETWVGGDEAQGISTDGPGEVKQ